MEDISMGQIHEKKRSGNVQIQLCIFYFLKDKKCSLTKEAKLKNVNFSAGLWTRNSQTFLQRFVF